MVASFPIKDWDAYELELDQRLGNDNALSKVIETRAQQDVKRVVFADAEDISVLKAASVVIEEKIAKPILLGTIHGYSFTPSPKLDTLVSRLEFVEDDKCSYDV